MGFFNKQTTQSNVKSEIVAQYFWRWAQAMKSALFKSPNKPFAYVDLFAGTGTYADGSPSTPVKVLERAISDPDLCSRLKTFFNEGDKDKCSKLQACIESIKGINNLKYKPVVTPQEVDQTAVTFFRDKWKYPTLSFVDPFGYKGVSVDLIHALISGWGCDCIVFFNYRRINMSIANKVLEQPINDFLGEERANSLRQRLKTTVGPSLQVDKAKLRTGEHCVMLYDLDRKCCPFLNADRKCDIYHTRPNEEWETDFDCDCETCQ